MFLLHNQLTDESLEHIKVYLPKLEDLSLSSGHITNSGTGHIGHMQHLKKNGAILNFCINITEDFIADLA